MGIFPFHRMHELLCLAESNGSSYPNDCLMLPSAAVWVPRKNQVQKSSPVPLAKSYSAQSNNDREKQVLSR